MQRDLRLNNGKRTVHAFPSFFWTRMGDPKEGYKWVVALRFKSIQPNPHPTLHPPPSTLHPPPPHHPSPPTAHHHRSVRTWTKPRCDPEGKRRVDVFALDAVFFPINVNDSHWTLCYALPQEMRIIYLDSMGASGKRTLKTIFHYFQEEHKDKKGCELPNQDEWTLESPGSTVPQQGNGSDCGVFASTFIDYISVGRDIHDGWLCQRNMPLVRRRMVLNIVNGRLDL